MPRLTDVVRRLVRNVSTFTEAGLPLLQDLSYRETVYGGARLDIAIDAWRRQYLADDPRQRDPRSLNHFEHKVYSQDGTDGILREIFRRVGEGPRHFVEFGSGNGLENNTAFLVAQGWSGLWMEGHLERVNQARETFQEDILEGRLAVRQDFVSKDNIETLLQAAGVPSEPTAICIDIDGNDYWVFEAISSFRPMVFVVEYNAMYPPDARWVMKYNPDHEWHLDSYQGASLSSLVELARRKGYALVACTIAGVNSFFLRDDLVTEAFVTGPTELFYHPPHYFVVYETAGHPRAFGQGVNL